MLNILAPCTLNYSEYESNNNQNTHALVVSVSKVLLFCVCVCECLATGSPVKSSIMIDFICKIVQCYEIFSHFSSNLLLFLALQSSPLSKSIQSIHFSSQYWITGMNKKKIVCPPKL